MSISEEAFKEYLGKKIKKLRTSRGYGVRAFALIAEIEHHQLINIENGRVDIRLSTLQKIARALELPPKDLLDFPDL